MPLLFSTYLGIDYSGAQTPDSGLPGVRVYRAGRNPDPGEVLPPPGPRKHWTRRGLAEWLASQLAAGEPVLAGIDHGFSFPLRYFERHGLPLDWPAFLDDFHAHWPTDERSTYVDFVRDGLVGNAAARQGNSRWRRLCEIRAGGAKSVFHFDVPGSVAKSTHAGLPWLRWLRNELGDRVHFWPFDGWQPPAGRSVIAEVYPALWTRRWPRDTRGGGRTADQHDAWCVAAGLREADIAGALSGHFNPSLTPQERNVARVEGWILGVP